MKCRYHVFELSCVHKKGAISENFSTDVKQNVCSLIENSDTNMKRCEHNGLLLASFGSRCMASLSDTIVSKPRYKTSQSRMYMNKFLDFRTQLPKHVRSNWEGEQLCPDIEQNYSHADVVTVSNHIKRY